VKFHDEQPLLVRGNPTVVRKMGFPEIILPNDVRNDLYVTLVSAEFHKGTKSSDKNIEVTVTAHNDSGAVINVRTFKKSFIIFIAFIEVAIERNKNSLVSRLI